MARLKLGGPRPRAADALALDEPPFDAILLDAPCTATGTIRRHPDVAWTKSPRGPEKARRRCSGGSSRKR